MKLKLKISILVVIICLFSIGSVYAIDDVNITDEKLHTIESDNQISTNDNITEFKTFTELSDLINATESGDILDLNHDYEYDEGFDTEGIIFNKTITINGNGHILDAKNSGRIFYINGNNVILKNITFKNGFSPESVGAVGCRGLNLIITDCIFINNFANGTSSPDGTKVVGGAVYINADNATIKNNQFINNSIRGSGAGIALDGENHLITNNTFIENKALRGMNGGGILIGSGYQVRILKNTFINNSAEMGGGAIELQHSEGDLIENNTFINNFGDYGGALSIYNTSYFKVSKNLFIANHATFEDSEKGLGGAIRVYLINFLEKTIISENNFIDSLAIHYGGALYIFGENVEISKNIFENNNAINRVGGTINIVGNNITLINNTIKNTSAGKHGGAIEISGNDMTIKSNKFINSSSMGTGGAIYVNGNNTVVSNNEFTNTHALKGGSICIEGDNTQIISNEISNSHAEDGAGAVYLSGKTPILKNNAISKATSTTLAGACMIMGSNAVVSNNEFSKNNAKTHIGALYVIGESSRITGNKFISNTAKTSAGAIRIDGKKATVTSNTFKSNNAPKGTDIFIWQGDSSKISANTFNKYGDMSVVTYGENIIFKDNKGVVEKTVLIIPVKSYGFESVKSLTAILKTKKGNVISGKLITFTVNGKTYKAKTNEKGQATVKLSLSKIKSYKCIAKFTKDKYNKASSKTVTIKVTKQATKLITPNKTFKKSVQSKKVTLTLKTNNNNVLKSKKITLKVNGKTYSSKTNKKGQATITVKLTKKGTFKYTAKFAGDSKYNTISKTGKIVIK